MLVHQMQVVDYSDDCHCEDCVHVRNMINVEIINVDNVQQRMLEHGYASGQDDVIDYNETFET